jgi:broad specificity phosphatase PhoE
LLWGAAPAQSAEPLSGETLVRALQGGGYNVYFRHAATDWSQSDDVREAGDWTNCEPSRMRQLSDTGRRAAHTVGEAMRALGIPVARVIASPYCRTVETARLMSLGPVETTTDVINLRVAEYFGGRKAIARRARARLATQPAPGTNTVLVAHGNLAREATDVYPGEGEGIVFRPDGNGDFAFVGRLTPKEWARLAQMIVIK